ncbi:MAG: substrate-binding domain-containing protein [Lachnospiraceae bacterium]|nr:substrate-binding domain-containing protein [Lachnospiraceae bacterium]
MLRFRKSRSFFAVTLLLLILLVIVAIQVNNREPAEKERKHVSLIVYGDDPERWENLRQGAGLVCGEKNADLSLLTMLSEDDAREQKEIIEREIEDGADALIIAACDSAEIIDFTNSQNMRIPIALVETTGAFSSPVKNAPVIAPDDYKMGYELGESLVENESDIVTVAIISENTLRDSVSLREQGLRDAIDGKVGKIINWERNEHEKDAKTRMFIQRALVSEATDVIVTFDNSTTDALLDALYNLNTSSKVYSIATSDKAVYYLYGKEIKVLVYPDEFAMGYLAAMNVLDGTNVLKKYRNTGIEYRLVTKENMYDEDNQALLFPFVN